MGSVNIKYNGSSIVNITTNSTKTLTTAGKYAIGNIEVVGTDACQVNTKINLGSSWVNNTYNNVNYTLTLATNSKYINGNIVFEVIPTHNYNAKGSWTNYNQTHHNRTNACGVCGKVGAADYATHSSWTYTNINATNHYKNCGVCSYSAIMAHDWSNTSSYINISATQHNYRVSASCTATGCGYSVVTNTKQAHNFVYTSINARNHYKNCGNCTYNSIAAHVWNNTVSYVNINATHHNKVSNNACFNCTYNVKSNTAQSHSFTYQNINTTHHYKNCAQACGFTSVDTHNNITTYSYSSINSSRHYVNKYNTCRNYCGFNKLVSSTTGYHSISNTTVGCQNYSATTHKFNIRSGCEYCSYATYSLSQEYSHWFDPQECFWQWYNYDVHYTHLIDVPCEECGAQISGTWYQGHVDDGSGHCQICGGTCSGGGGGGGGCGAM